MPASALVAILSEHVTKASGAAITSRQAQLSPGGSLTMRMASGSSLQLSSVAGGTGDAPLLIVNPGAFSSNASVSLPDTDCLVGPLSTAAVVHGIDSVLLSPFATAMTLPGPFLTARADTTTATPSAVPISLFYPLTAAAQPPIVFAHGMRAPVAVYAATLTRLASHGFVVAAVRDGLNIVCPGPSCSYANVSVYWADVAETAGWLYAAASNASVSTLLAGRVDGSRGVGLFGHSLGGLAVLQVAARASASIPISAVLALSPSASDPCSGIAGLAPCGSADAVRALVNGSALSVLLGSRDTTVDPAGGEAAWAAPRAGGGSSLLSVLARGTHCFTELPSNALLSQCGWSMPEMDTPPPAGCAELPLPPAAAAAACRVLQPTVAGMAGQLPRLNLPQAAQLLATRRHAVAFFKGALGGDARAKAMLQGDAPQPLFTDAMMRAVALKS